MTPDELAAALIAREEMPPEKGDLGPVGPQGVPGVDGRAGTDGRPGAVGKAGIDGKTGPRGPKGDKGDKGDPGEPGKDGRDGKDGADAAVPIMRGGVVRGGGIAGITVQNDGTPVGTPNTITTLNFPSGGVTAGTGNSVDIPSGGSGGSQTLAQTLALGNDANQLRITNAADGVDPSDVATVGQLGGVSASFSVVVSDTFGLTYDFGGEYDVTGMPPDITAEELQGALSDGSYPGTPSDDYFAVTGTGTAEDPFLITAIGSYAGTSGTLVSDDANAVVTVVVVGHGPFIPQGGPLTEDLDVASVSIEGTGGSLYFGSFASLTGSDGPNGVFGSAAAITGGNGNGGATVGARVFASAGGASDHGKVNVRTNNQVGPGTLVDQIGNGDLVYAQLANVPVIEPEVTDADAAVNALISALINAGLMAPAP